MLLSSRATTLGGQGVCRCHSSRHSASSRTVWPLGLVFWGPTWTLGAWCELRQDFRTFRLDRMQNLQVLDATFVGTGLLERYLHLVQQA